MANTNINSKYAGVSKPLGREIAVLWFSDANPNTTDITVETDLSTKQFKSAGAVSVDGISFGVNSEEPEKFKDFNGNVIDTGEASSTETISFKLLEVLNAETAKLFVADSAITAGSNGYISKIVGNANPSNKAFIVDYKIKDKRVRIILRNCSFASRGEEKLANDSLAGIEVTYNVLTDDKGVTSTKLVG